MVTNELKLQLPANSWVSSASDIHLSGYHTEASVWAEAELAARFEARSDGPGAIVLNGDIIELWAGSQPNVAGALGAHPKFTKAIKEFSAQPNHHVIFVVGNHDGRLGWGETDQKVLKAQLGAELAFRLELK